MINIKQLIKFLLLVSAVISIFIIGIFFIILISLKDEDTIEPTVYSSAQSPNKTYQATIFEFDKGATTGFKTFVSIVTKDQNSELLKNSVFEVSDHPSHNNITLKWIDENKLLINHHANGNFKIFKKLDSFNGISIFYSK